MRVLGRDLSHLQVLRPRDAQLLRRALIVFVIFLWLLYTLEQVARLRHARMNPTTQQEVERRSVMPWPYVTVCNARTNTTISPLVCTKAEVKDENDPALSAPPSAKSPMAGCVPFRSVTIAARSCLAYHTNLFTSQTLPEFVAFSNIHFKQTKVSPLWGLSVYIHAERDLTPKTMVTTAGMKVPAGQAGIGRLRKSASYFLDGTGGEDGGGKPKSPKEYYQILSSSTLMFDYPGYEVNTVAGVSLRWETTDVETFREHIDYTFDDLVGLSAGFAGLGDLSIRFLEWLMATLFVVRRRRDAQHYSSDEELVPDHLHGSFNTAM